MRRRAWKEFASRRGCAMDVSNLIPAPGPTAAKPGAPNRTAPDSAPVPLKAIAAAATGGANTARPATAPPSVSDRLERSPELQRNLAELEAELGRRSEASAHSAEKLMADVREAKDASHETLVRAALGILHGELYF